MYIKRAKVQEVQKVVLGVVVGVINFTFQCFFKTFFKLLITVNFLTISFNSLAGTLPVDTVDSLYHRYEGGGMTIDGPFILVRKSVGNQFSLSGHYYVDSVSAASVDVLATASAYTEERTEVSAGVDYLNEKTLMSFKYTNSEENDFTANSAFFSVSQDFFGDLTNFTLGYARGWDDVGQLGKSETEDADRHIYQVGMTQVLTKNALIGVNLETITDEGFLQNPYRQVRFIDPGNTARGYSYQLESYPETRTSTAMAFRGLYYLPYRASIKGEYRYFNDSWGIESHTYDLLYVHPLDDQWIVEGKFRYYSQTQADFYQDLFPFKDSQTHLARDKELSNFSGTTFGAGISYELGQGAITHIDRLKFTLLLDYIQFEYDNFRDVVAGEGLAVGTEPLYEFDAWVTRASITLEY